MKSLDLSIPIFFLFYSFSLALLTTPAWAQRAYISGREVCRLTTEFRPTEIGFWTEVPLDYNDLKRGTTEVYAWTRKPFDAKKGTFIYFAGGPGGTAHISSFIEFADWNVVYLDQRGAGCSRPATVEQSLDGTYYSSEAIARDADRVREKLGLRKWSIFGHSYGTVPATIYAHLFPSSTQSLVLEGTIFEGDAKLWHAPYRLRWLQKFYDKLPSDLQAIVQELSTPPTGNSRLFSGIANSMMYSDASERNLLSYLEDQKQLLHPNLIQNISNNILDGILVDPIDDILDVKNLLYFSDNNWEALTCRELSSMQRFSEKDYLFEKGKFYVEGSENSQLEWMEKCSVFGLFPGGSLINPYQAKRYPVQIPVTYFQGTTDGATVAPMAVHHYKTVPQGSAQILLKIGGGHAPNLALLIEEEQSPETRIASEAQLKIFATALRGQLVDGSQLQEINAVSEQKWVQAHK